MAAIAKFISYDGGIAFSEQVMKIQKRGQDAMTFPLDDVVSVRVRRPQEDTDGFIHVNTTSGRRYRILFDDDQLQEAIQFKREFDSYFADSDESAVDSNYMNEFLQVESEESTSKEMQANRGGRSSKHHNFTFKWWHAVICVVFIGIVVFIAIKSNTNSVASRMSNKAASISESAISAVDAYLDHSASGDETGRKLSDLKAEMDDYLDSDSSHSADIVISSRLLSLELAVSSDSYNNTSDSYDKVIDSRNELAEAAGLKKR